MVASAELIIAQSLADNFSSNLPRAFLIIGRHIAAAALFAFGCARTDSGERTSAAATQTESATATSTSSVTQTATTPIVGVRLVVDSGASDPAIEVERSDYVVRLPKQMAVTLFDSLPQFVPLARSAYDSSVLKWVDANDAAAAPLSVVEGDFDGILEVCLLLNFGNGDRRTEMGRFDEEWIPEVGRDLSQ